MAYHARSIGSIDTRPAANLAAVASTRGLSREEIEREIAHTAARIQRRAEWRAEENAKRRALHADAYLAQPQIEDALLDIRLNRLRTALDAMDADDSLAAFAAQDAAEGQPA